MHGIVMQYKSNIVFLWKIIFLPIYCTTLYSANNLRKMHLFWKSRNLAKRKRSNGQTMIYQTLHIKLSIEKHERH